MMFRVLHKYTLLPEITQDKEISPVDFNFERQISFIA